MGEVVAGYGVSHTAMILSKYQADNPAHRRVHRAFDQIRATIAHLAPDLIVVVSSEHLMSFDYKAFPQICIGIGQTCVGWGEAGIPSASMPLAGDFAEQLLEYGLEAGFDLAFSGNPRLDHGFMTPLTLIRPEMDIPVVPVWQNASTPPLPPLWRSAAFGGCIREFITRWPTAERVVLVGAGGLSHWVATPGMGHINTEFDRRFLAAIQSGDLDNITSMKLSDVITEAGNGAPEIRNWITVMAAAPGPGIVLAYEPIPDWATGIAVAELLPVLQR